MEETKLFTAKQVGERIKQRRGELNLSMSGLGERLGVNKSTVQRYEANGVDPKRHYLIFSIAEALETSEEWLTGLSEQKEDECLTRCRKIAEKQTDSFLATLEASSLTDAHKEMLTELSGCFMDMFSVLTMHFDKAMQEMAQASQDAGLKESLMKYAIESAVIEQSVYRRNMEQPIETYKTMMDHFLHIFDNDSTNHIAEMLEIRNAAKQAAAGGDTIVAK